MSQSASLTAGAPPLSLPEVPAQAAPDAAPATRRPAGRTVAFPPSAAGPAAFVPRAPRQLEAVGLAPHELETLCLKYLLAAGEAEERQMARAVRLPWELIHSLLASLTTQGLTTRGDDRDHVHRLSQAGQDRARRAAQHCGYVGAAPVAWNDYLESVRRQSVRGAQVRLAQLRAAFRDLLLPTEVLAQIGQSVNAAQALLLFGPPGNGKTSIAWRIARLFPPYIWIPRVVHVAGEWVRLFDPAWHHEAPLAEHDPVVQELGIDRRWVLIRRPLTAVGHELRLEQFELQRSQQAPGLLEAPLHWKSNCGLLLVDDLGRQAERPENLLQRLTALLEKGADTLLSPAGGRITLPFDQLLVLATNLAPTDVADEASLRRIRYKIELCDPTLQQFRDLLRRAARRLSVAITEDDIEHLIETHYNRARRAVRFCHASDLMELVRTYCEFYEQPPRTSMDAMDIAAKNYFANL